MNIDDTTMWNVTVNLNHTHLYRSIKYPDMRGSGYQKVIRHGHALYNALSIPAISHWIAGELDYWGGGGVTRDGFRGLPGISQCKW